VLPAWWRRSTNDLTRAANAGVCHMHFPVGVSHALTSGTGTSIYSWHVYDWARNGYFQNRFVRICQIAPHSGVDKNPRACLHPALSPPGELDNSVQSLLASEHNRHGGAECLAHDLVALHRPGSRPPLADLRASMSGFWLSCQLQ
jgi:hypothetical protein